VRAILVDVSDRQLEERRRLGLDRFDEMWQGELHMAPAPYPEHQRILDDLIEFARPLLRRKRLGLLISGVNVFAGASTDEDYRIPDFTFLASGREDLIAVDGIRGGGPDAVLEIRSPRDETYDKLPFFAALGVREVIVIDRDSKRPEVFRLAGSQYLAVAPDREGWVVSEVLRLRFRQVPGATPRLAAEDLDDPATRADI
jgi:Uma2 family endonuclease